MRTPLTILLIITISTMSFIGSASLFSVVFDQYRTTQETQDAELQSLIAFQQSQIDTLEELIIGERTARETLQSQQLASQQQTAQQLSTIKQDLVDSQNSLATIISEWKSRVVSVECAFIQGPYRITTTGSGLITMVNGRPQVVTNKHIAQDTEGTGETARDCIVTLPEQNITLEIPQTAISTHASRDAAFLAIQSPSMLVTTIATQQSPICPRASIGDEIVILGYPSIGSGTDITATEGIVAGYDGDFYITSAKVERGNSGGATIAVKDNCYLGIPTFTRAGLVESLARILDARTILP